MYVILLDLKKAFGGVDHDILLNKRLSGLSLCRSQFILF